MCGHLSLEVEKPQGLELDVGFGAQVAGQGAGQVLQLLDAMGDSSLQSEDVARDNTCRSLSFLSTVPADTLPCSL